MTTKTNPYYARLIKDLAVTFNFSPLSAQEIASYWKRSRTDIQKTADKLAKLGVVAFNSKNEIAITPSYKKYFKKNPELALAVAKQGF